MIIKLLFVIFVFLILKVFLIRFDFHDYFNVVLSLLLVFICYLYIFGESFIFIIPIFVICLTLIVYSYISSKTSDNTIIILNGNINFKNMFKNNYSISNLLDETKRNKVPFLNEDICAILVNDKLVFYSKNHNFNIPVTLVIDGKLCLYELKKIGKSRNWLFNRLLEQKCNIEDVFYSFFYNQRLYIIKK